MMLFIYECYSVFSKIRLTKSELEIIYYAKSIFYQMLCLKY